MDQMGISKCLINEEVRGQQNPEGESVAQCNKDKQMKAGNVGDWWNDLQAETQTQESLLVSSLAKCGFMVL